MDRQAHWETIYRTKPHTNVSWYTPHLQTSLDMIVATGVEPTARILDVGGGASTLVDDLLERGYENAAVLDISATALSRSRERLGDLAERVTWLEGDVIQLNLCPPQVTLWHDRAVFHFLTNSTDRERYINTVKR